MRTRLVFSVLFVVLALSSCGVKKDFESFSVAPERLFSSNGSNVFVFDYSELKVREDVKSYFDYFKDLKIWHEIGVDLQFAGFVDDLNRVAGEGAYENLFLPVFQSGFKVALSKENLSGGFFNQDFVISANVKEKDTAKILIDAYLGKKLGEKLEKMTVSGVDVWLLEEDSLFLAKKGSNFVFSNDFAKFQETLKNLKEENFSKFVLNVNRDYTFSPFVQVYLKNGTKFAGFLEEKGIRFFGSFAERKTTNFSKSLLKYLPAEGSFFLVEDLNLSSYVSLFSNFDTEKFLGLKKDEFSKLIDTRFAFLMNFEEVIPGATLLIDTKEIDFLLVQKFLKFANRFFEDLGKSLTDQLILSGVISEEGFLKISNLNDDIKRAYLDLSFLSPEKLSELSVLFPGITADTKVEFYFGLIEDNILVLSFGSDFMSFSKKQGIADSKDFLSARERLSLEGENTVFYVNFLNLWKFYENFSKVLFSWGAISENVVKNSEFFREIFLDKLSAFILLGEDNDDFSVFEGFLSTWK
ncbi:MAG: hypothetical protein RBS56_01540 [Candidatus Gracilibacteria bacterium]|jgi:hypothetical protein|nr:hypothetical protein [Candidatus Gracilibacteria bacterium]